MPVHHCCRGSWSLGRFWVQRQEPAQQNSPAPIWFQSGCLSVSKAPYCTSPVLLSTAARQQTDDLINETAKSLWCYAQKELKALCRRSEVCLLPTDSNSKQLSERAEEAHLPADSCFNLLEVVMRHCTAQQRFDKVPAVVSPTDLLLNLWKLEPMIRLHKSEIWTVVELAHSQEIIFPHFNS